MNFFTDEKFIIPFMATLGASSTIILMQFISRYHKEKKQKIYASSYIADVCSRLIQSEFILKKHTIIPHIEATKKIIEGDKELLSKMFLSDEFDILTAKAMDFNHLPNEYKLLVGCDDIKLVQAFDFLIYLHRNEGNREALNDFVKKNLKSTHDFLALTQEKQKDNLYTYWDYLSSIEHESNRTIFFICNIIIPQIKKYIHEWQFLFFSTKDTKNTITNTEAVINENRDLIPEENYLEIIKDGGIQSELKNHRTKASS